MKIRLRCTLLALLLTGLPLGLWAGPKPTQKAKGPVPKGNCAVCGMYVANFPDWAAVISFKDGAQAWFDGPKDLFTYLLDLKRYAAKRNVGDITLILVKDYYGLKHVDGRQAFFVIGSDVMGPMGRELVPFGTESAARDFLRDHHGVRVLTFREVTPDTLKSLE
ncbi:MAG: nitrous oxide reductase accessory protein NosL [Geothrix sp.]|uniref:nitrous oxide reductase accessory protein NosL n=1 Tax=Geothrix sp. TaxID=1962974 RepID=UPI0017DC8FF0|nr:nitrous oxide reductase accessory protein NosL [Geothrix sp.]NWJ39780.1 nitrous oxide reductase accessory protein NosL [Geothrix sp.]WIL22207.1 MAG: nitrous oxide reductase accessory protein NosL [Geothrix sp.]